VDNETIFANFQTRSANVWEDSGTYLVYATLSGPASVDLSIPVTNWQPTSQSGGYAVAGQDYTLSSSVLLVRAGQTVSEPITLTIIDDSQREVDEAIAIALAPAATSPVKVGTVSQAQVVIRDNETQFSISGPGPLSESVGPRVFKFRLQNAVNRDVAIGFTLSGTAQRGADFVAPSISRIVIPAGSTSVDLTISVNNDQFSEDDETILLATQVLTSGVETLSSIASTTILNDDGDPSVGIYITTPYNLFGNYYIYEFSKPQNYTVELSGAASQRDVAVKIGTRFTGASGRYVVNGTNNGWVIIPAGQRIGRFTIAPINNQTFDGSTWVEPYVVDVRNATGQGKVGTKLSIYEDDAKAAPAPPARNSTPPNANSLSLPVGVAGTSGAQGGLVFINSGSQSQPPNPGALSLPIASNGLLDGATVFADADFNGVKDFLDLDGDGVQDEDEPDEVEATTALDGSFAIVLPEAYDRNADGVIDDNEAQYVVVGGLDEAIGIPLKTPMTAPIGVSVITPLTTLAQALRRLPDGRFDTDAALNRIAEAIGAAGYQIGQRSTVHDIVQGNSQAVTVYKELLKIQGTVLGVGELLDGVDARILGITPGQTGSNSSRVQEFTDAVYQDIASRLQEPGASVNFSLVSVVEAILRGTASAKGVVVSESLVAGAASIIAESNSRYDLLNFSDFSTAGALLHEMLKVKKVMLGDAATALLGVDSTTIANVQAAFTGTALISRIAAASVASSAVPPAVGVGNATLVEGNTGTKVLVFSVYLQGEHEAPVSVNYRTADFSASADLGDYVSKTGTLTWAAGDTSTKTVSVTVNSDATFETDEILQLLLTSSVGAVIRIQEGYGYIDNDDQYVRTGGSNEGSQFLLTDTTDPEDGMRLVENGSQLFSGPLHSGIDGQILGVDNASDHFRVEFVSTTAKTDRLVLNGGVGSEVDTFVARNGDFEQVEFVIGGAAGSLLRFDHANSNRVSEVTLINVETQDLGLASLKRMLVRIPASVTDVILEDAVSDDTGRMRIRSASSAFPTVEFVNPANELVLLYEGTTNPVTVNSTDSGFTGRRRIARAGLVLSDSAVPETAASGATIGTVTSAEPVMAEGISALTLVSGEGSTDNAAFSTSGNAIRTAIALDYETKSIYSIRVRATNAASESIEQVLVISVTNVNEAPTSISLSHSSVAENLATGTAVGSFSTTDADSGNTFTYSFVAGTGSTDNASFTIDGSTLKTAAVFDYETKSSYSVRVRVTDQGGLTYDKIFTISVTDVQEDVTPPSSRVTALPATSTSASFTVAVTGTDSGVGASGIADYDLYYSTGSSFIKFATVTAASPSTTFTGAANTTYWFRSIARDAAGNVEVKTSSDTYTRIGDVVPPTSQVTAAPFVSSGLFNLQMTGSKLSGAIMTQFDVYVVVDSNAPVLVGTASAVATSTAGQFTGSLTYQGLADGTSHTYRFYSRGKDGSGNVEAAPGSGDVSVTVTFSAPASLTATGIDVQNSANQRSYVRYLDLLFSGDPSALLSGNRIAIERFGIDAATVTAGTGTAVTGFGMTQSSNKLKLDFGATGIGGLRDAGNGFYRVRLDMNQDGDFTDAVDQAFEFYRLFGDANGDKVVDVLDTNLVTAQVGRSGTNLDGDLDGNGTVNATDRLYTTQQRGKNLLLALRSLLDD
jgi:hypothetical protein